jgi:hypothetical protein
VLANVYLHYVLDLWAHAWRQKCARGEVIVVRYADDFVVGFQYHADAVKFKKELAERLAKFELELHPDKTRLIEFGRFATERRQAKGLGRPETFDFLGFTHICARTEKGLFFVRRQTMRKRMQVKLRNVKQELRRRLHDPVPAIGSWLKSVVQGYDRYHGVPLNRRALASFRYALVRLWHKALRRRSQRTRMTWARMEELAARWIPNPKIYHPWPARRLHVTTRGRSRVR